MYNHCPDLPGEPPEGNNPKQAFEYNPEDDILSEDEINFIEMNRNIY